MNMKRFQRLLNEGQDDWIVNYVRYYPINKTVVLVIDHIGPDPSKMRQLLRLDKKFVRDQAAGLVELAYKYGPLVRPHIKQVAVDVKG
jgi:hypothetical protein